MGPAAIKGKSGVARKEGDRLLTREFRKKLRRKKQLCFRSPWGGCFFIVSVTKNRAGKKKRVTGMGRRLGVNSMLEEGTKKKKREKKRGLFEGGSSEKNAEEKITKKRPY